MWCFDGSFEGFLSCVAQSYHQRTLPQRLWRSAEAQPSLFDAPMRIETQRMEALRVLRAFRRTAGREATALLVHAFLCDEERDVAALLRYMRLGFKAPHLLGHLAQEDVFEIERRAKRTRRTLHRMIGFCRFETLEEGMLYARIEPPQDVLALMGPHFLKRMGGEAFIIHDLKRAKALIGSEGTCKVRDVHDFDAPTVDEAQQRYVQLWRLFFDRVAIKERRNAALQRHHVPLLYRTWMSEFAQST
ncbi:MAG: TIGR03915 family putative DNA repair protein [Campylobacterales bacterium]|nr:TIGR03915 family putative DNA repair protein [Campylobacterales bacterium]